MLRKQAKKASTLRIFNEINDYGVSKCCLGVLCSDWHVHLTTHIFVLPRAS